MNLISISNKYPDQAACIRHLEAVRWGDNPTCPRCKSTNIARKADSKRVGRWNCHACKSSFNVLSGTVFQKTRIAIGLMVNAKKSLSSCQLARDLQVSQPAAWYMQQRIRVAMVASERELLQGIINHSQAYVDGSTHTHTIEGFWSLLKRAWYGQHHHYSKPYTLLYLAEAC